MYLFWFFQVAAQPESDHLKVGQVLLSLQISAKSVANNRTDK